MTTTNATEPSPQGESPATRWFNIMIPCVVLFVTVAAIIGCSDGTTNDRSQTSAKPKPTVPEPTVCSECEGEGEIFEQGQCTDGGRLSDPRRGSCGRPLTTKITWSDESKYYCLLHGKLAEPLALAGRARVEEGRYGEFSECPSCGGDGQVND